MQRTATDTAMTEGIKRYLELYKIIK